jgi:hypothetical protein
MDGIAQRMYRMMLMHLQDPQKNTLSRNLHGGRFRIVARME